MKSSRVKALGALMAVTMVTSCGSKIAYKGDAENQGGAAGASSGGPSVAGQAGAEAAAGGSGGNGGTNGGSSNTGGFKSTSGSGGTGDGGAGGCLGEECVDCEDACSMGESVCSDDALRVCESGMSGCLVWSPPVACSGIGKCADDKSCAARCTSHRDQCPGGAGCDMFTGACLPPENVWHVDEDGDAGTLPTINDALSELAIGQAGTIIVHESSAGQTLNNVGISGARTVALLAATGESPVQNGGLSTTVTVANGATVFIEAWEIRGAQPLLIDDAIVVLDRSTVLGRVAIETGANLLARNSIMNAVTVDAGATLDLLYSTVVNEFGSAATIECSQAGPTGVTIRNSLVLALGDSPEPVTAACNASIRYSASEESLGGTTNTILGSMDGAPWFVDLDNNDFHLASPPSSLLTAARWQAGDPATDIDGTPRPTVDSAPDVAGAHRLVQGE